MRHRSGLSSAAFAGLVGCLAMVAGCAQMGQPREWGQCAGLGAVAGAAAGAASGIVIADNTHGKGESNNGKAIFGGSGAAIGAIIGAVTGHFICDPIKPPPPPPPQVAQAPPLPPPPPPPPPPPAKEKLVLRGVHFDFNKSDIRPEDEPVLDEAAETLKSHADVTIDVDGYCDAIGGDEYNQKLSERRAGAVAKYLEGKGLPAGRMVAKGFGKTNFVATNDTDEGRAQNRRVELVPE